MAKESEFSITRVYDAPVKLVWEAWTDPKKAAKWWGPRGFTITTHSKDLRPGGIWHYTMHGPDGTDWPNKTKYIEVVPMKKLVYDHGGNDEQEPLFKVTVTFDEVKGKTVMVMIMDFGSPEKAKEMIKFIKQAGGNATWDRLGEYLGDEAGKTIFIINRSFETPIANMYKMWSEPKHFSKWLPPAGFTMEFIREDARVGGTSFYKMTDGKSSTMYGLVKYHEMTPVTRLVYTQWFCDEKGNISRHPMESLWPEATLSTVTLSEEGPNQTRVTVEWTPQGSKEEIERFRKLRPEITMGWTGSFDKLEELL